MTNILLIGNGAHGQKYISTINNKYPNIKLTVAERKTWNELLISLKPDGVIIATPPQSHVEIASTILARQIPVIIEKPLSLSLSEAQQLTKYQAPILVNHIHLFSDAYEILEKTINPFNITNIETNGYGCNPPRDYSGLWDYGPHDLSLILDLSQRPPISVLAEKIDTLTKITLKFDNFVSTSLVGNHPSQKARTLQIVHDGITSFYDDQQRPQHHCQPLTNMLETFLDCLDGNNDHRIGLDLSLKIMKILEKCDESIVSGKEIKY